MELIFPHHNSGQGIYAKAKKANPRKLAKLAEELAAWLDDKNGHFFGTFSRAYAISHSQVAHEPYNLFVVAKELCEKQEKGDRKHTQRNFYFPARVIFNPEILEAEKTITRSVPVRKLAKNGEMAVVPELKEIDNIIRVAEGCMSFPHRSERKMDRYFRIKVRYQFLQKLPLVGYISRTRTEWVEGLKSHMFQHEVEHACGKNIHFK